MAFYKVLLFLKFIAIFETIVGCWPVASTIRRRDIQTNRPIIGVLAQSTNGEGFQKYGKAYIAASYIKYLESSGARVVPIMNNLTDDQIVKLFRSINGVLFPGGGANLLTSGYAKTGRVIYNLAKKSFDEGDYFPLWGTCLGSEFLSVLTCEDENILGHTDSENLPLPLNFSQDYRNSRLFRDIPDETAKFLSSAPTTMNMHRWSVYTSRFRANVRMNEFFRILSTNYGRKGVEFVSTMEGKKYPFYSTQWHPEKNSFEWTLNENIPHEAMSIKVTQYMSNFFVNEARYSSHKFETAKDEQDALIYNYNPTYTGNISNFDQCYLF